MKFRDLKPKCWQLSGPFSPENLSFQRVKVPQALENVPFGKNQFARDRDIPLHPEGVKEFPSWVRRGAEGR
jgi:hypothetical protein